MSPIYMVFFPLFSFHFSPLPPALSLFLFSIFSSSFLFLFFCLQSFYHVAQAGLEFTLYPNLASNSWKSSYLSPLSTSERPHTVKYHLEFLSLESKTLVLVS